ncbi:hypothetical protein [Heyndrickxia coagulans]|uniref:hypothetical protein n=1 Tax=Heyndrickxia coagulans TaxID=1398 RepID=UPI0015C676DC|nr:hypothetical protein [Heyndrickxia coagulans]
MLTTSGSIPEFQAPLLPVRIRKKTAAVWSAVFLHVDKLVLPVILDVKQKEGSLQLREEPGVKHQPPFAEAD